MPESLLHAPRRRQSATLAGHITLLSSLLTLLVLLPALGLTYLALQSQVLESATHELEAVTTSTRLRFEYRLDTDLQGILNTRRLSVLGNALADAGERARLVRPVLEDQCRNAAEIETLVLTDFSGAPMEQGCLAADTPLDRLGALLTKALAEGRPAHALEEAHGTLRLLLAVPVEPPPTGNSEVGLATQIDLGKLFGALVSGSDPRYRLRLRLYDSATSQPLGNDIHDDRTDRLHYMVPVVSHMALPLAVEASVDAAAVYQPIRVLIARVMFTGVAALAVMILLARHFASRIAAPLAELERTARRVAQGDFTRLPEPELATDPQNAFRQLSSAIYRMIVSLRDTQLQLSSTLAERTREVERAEAKLLEEERAHGRRIENLHEIVVEVDLQRRLLFLNHAWTRVTGHPVSESIGKEYTEFMHADDLKRLMGQLQSMRERNSEAQEFECRVVCRDGSTRHLELRVSPLRDHSGATTGFGGIMIDVTERHEAEMAIAIRDRAIESTTSGIAIVDLRRDDCPVVYVNHAFERITGYDAEDVLGRNNRFLHAGAPDQPELHTLRNAITNRQPCTVILRNFRKDGTPFWNQLSVSPVFDPTSGEATHFVGVQNDVTARKDADDALLDWLARLDIVFTLSPDALVCFDNQGMVSYANTAAEKLFGRQVGALTGMSVGEFRQVVASLADPGHPFTPLVDPATAPPPPCGFQEGIIHLQTPARCALHQTARQCEASTTSLILYFRDVSREVELDRMKSDFLATAAHELRTPMSSIMGFSELLLMRNFDVERTRDMLTTINRQAQRLTSLLNDLLDLARIEARKGDSLRLEVHPLADLLRDALAAFHIPDGRHHLETRIPDPLPHLRVDRDKFQQALLNLLSNACKFSPEGGPIEVEVFDLHPDGLALAGITVRDHGIGMREEDAAHAFERFYRADRSGHIPGTGLGLSLVQEIMSLHGGRASLNSKPGEGTSVTLWFPVLATNATTGPATVEA